MMTTIILIFIAVTRLKCSSMHLPRGDDNNNYQITTSRERDSQLTCCIVDVEERREWIILRHQSIANLARHSLVSVLCLHL